MLVHFPRLIRSLIAFRANWNHCGGTDRVREPARPARLESSGDGRCSSLICACLDVPHCARRLARKLEDDVVHAWRWADVHGRWRGAWQHGMWSHARARARVAMRRTHSERFETMMCRFWRMEGQNFQGRSFLQGAPQLHQA